MPDHDPDIRDQRLEEARTHMSAVAIGLQAGLAPINAVGVLMGAAIGILESTYDSEKAAQYLREIADELETDRAGALHGHA